MGETGAQISEMVRALPMSAHGVAAAVFVVGLVVWLLGGRLLRAGFALVGGGGLAAAGWALAGSGVLAGAVEPWIPAVVGLVVGAVLGLVLFRMTVSAALAVLLGVLAPLVTTGLIDRYGSPIAEGEARTALEEAAEPLSDRGLMLEGVEIEQGAGDDWFSDLEERAADAAREGVSERARREAGRRAGEAASAAEAAAGLTDEQEEVLRAGAERVRAFFAALWREVEPAWTRTPPADRAVVVLSSVVGLAVGFSIGVVLPRGAAGLAAASVGAALWLPAGVWLTTAAWPAAAQELPTGPLAWVGVWGALVAVGSAIQFMWGRGRADKTGDRDAEGPEA